MEYLKSIFDIHVMKTHVCFFAGVFGGIVTYLFGGWSEGMEALLFFMVTDYLSGLAVAGIFKKSSKTDGGGLKSDVGFKGIIKKVFMLIVVALMYRLDILFGINYLCDLCIISFLLNELISITENIGLMGIPLPPVVTNAIELLNKKVGDPDEDKSNRN